jgi:site-specific recombinase XerD
VNPSRQAPLRHPLSDLLERAIEDITASLTPETARQYRGTARNFLLYLADNYPRIDSLEQLRRDPHILGWLAHLHSHQPPLATSSLLTRILFLRGILLRLAWTAHVPELACLLHREDAPRRPRRLPRPLTAQQDEAVQRELVRRNDLAANVFLLLRHTGMRIGEAVDLSIDCLHSCGPDQWAILVPLGKLKTERMVPVDSLVCQLVQRLRFLRSFDPLPQDGRLIARTFAKDTLIRKLREYLHEVCNAAGISARIVPHRMRHTYATEMLRSGVSFPAIMKLLGHKSADMTTLYVDVVQTDLQREFHQAQSHPRYIAPRPQATLLSPRPGLDGVIDSLLVAQHTLEMFRRTMEDDLPRRRVDRFSNRLTKILAEVRKLTDQNGHRLAG